MRTLVSVRDILDESNRVEQCPRCSPEHLLETLQCTMDFAKGATKINKTCLCRVCGVVTITRRVKTVKMWGKDAEVIPPHG